MRGGPGRDSIDGGAGNDALEGDEARDRIWGDLGDDSVEGGTAGDHLSGGEGNERLRATSATTIIGGGAGNDALDGAFGRDRCPGPVEDCRDPYRGGRSFCTAATETTASTGTAAEDVLVGGAGNDFLVGGRPATMLPAGPGRRRHQRRRAVGVLSGACRIAALAADVVYADRRDLRATRFLRLRGRHPRRPAPTEVDPAGV